jgi:hypothetical protein
MIRFAYAMILAAVAMSAAPEAANSLEVKVAVPPEISRMARDRLAGNARPQSPVLMLEGLETGQDEALSVRVLGPPDDKGIRPVIGVTSTIGAPQKKLKRPLQKVTLAVPLNDRALDALIKDGVMSLVLEIRNNPSREALRVDRVYFVKPD